ncbi:unnamed protein product [Orchesella dallaii]|uniref:Protein takeout n=1 Tax=Orchesella dallaii TaxID=48710 RepID=A0ABP1Q9D6_9HEXA
MFKLKLTGLLLLGLCLSVNPIAGAHNDDNSLDKESEVCVQFGDYLSKLILKIINDLKQHMHDGIPSLGIPPLDPLQLDDNSFHVSKSYQYDIAGNTRRSQIENLREFNVTHISTSILRLQVNMSIDIPFVLVTGRYSLRGKLINVIPVSGNGPFILKPEDVTASITSELKLEHSHFQMKSMDFNLDMRDLFVQFQGLYGGNSVGNLVNKLLNKFGLGLYHKIESKLHESLRVALMTVINEKLKEIPLVQLVGGMNSPCREQFENVHAPNEVHLF